MHFDINGDYGHHFTTDEMTEDWFNLKATQTETSGEFKFSVIIDNIEVYSTVNTTPRVFKNVQARVGRGPDYRIVDGSFRNLLLKSKQNDFFS